MPEMSARISIALAVASLVLSAACGFDGRAGSQVVVRDSAGIEIVENVSPTWAEGEGWRLSDEPVLTIGVVEGPEEYQLFDVFAALRLKSGEIVVAMFQTNKLRFYDSTGTFLRSVGREGGGPGEFSQMMEMWHINPDSLAVFEYGNARVTVLSARGVFGRTFRFDQVPNRALTLPAGPFADGSFLGWSHAWQTEVRGEGIHRGTAIFVHSTRDGELIDTLVRRPGVVRNHATVAGRDMMASPPFPRNFSAAVSANGWFYGAKDEFEIELYSPDGRLRRLIRRAVANRPVTAEHAEEWRQWALERYSQMPAVFRNWRANQPVPETMPAHDAMVSDDEGNLWVAEYRLPNEQPSWAVFDVDGRFLGNVDTPARGEVTHIGSDFVLGVWKGEMDVEQVRMYRLVK
jgi:hypothetical protein